MASVYWIRLKEHTDFMTQGYIGVTSQCVLKRFSQHLYKSSKGFNLPLCNAIRKHKSELLVETLLIGETEYVYDMEKRFRPSSRIGWNCAQGGDKSGLGRIRKERSNEHCKALSDSLKGREFSDSHRASISEAQKLKWKSRDRSIGSATNANKEIWSIADLIYNDRQSGMTGSLICEKYGIEKLSKIHSMIYVHFKNGWNPNEDVDWIAKYKEIK